MTPSSCLAEECERTSFKEFVNRVLALQSNSPMNKFSIRCHKGVDDKLVEDWVVKALRRGATDLSLVLFFPSRLNSPAPARARPSATILFNGLKNLIKLKLGSGSGSLGRFHRSLFRRDLIFINLKTLHLDSLVEARLDVGSNIAQMIARDNGFKVPWDATNLIMGMHNVQTLHLTSDTLETVPVFHNLNHLSIESGDERGWQALPLLLRNCPSLHTLIFYGLHHGVTDGCGDACDCIPSFSSSCLSSCTVKILKILDFGATCGEMSLAKHFLKKLPQLEHVTIVLHLDSSQEERLDPSEVSNALEIAPRASHNCKLEVVGS